MSWLDTDLIGIRVLWGDFPEQTLYNATREEYLSFLASCSLKVGTKWVPLEDRLPSFERVGQRFSTNLNICFMVRQWRRIQSQCPSLITGAYRRLLGSDNASGRIKRALYLYSDSTSNPQLRIEVYADPEEIEQYKGYLDWFFGNVSDYLAGNRVDINISIFTGKETQDPATGIRPLQEKVDRKVLHPFVERATSEMISLIKQSIVYQTDPQALTHCLDATSTQRQIADEFAFVINTARKIILTVGTNVPTDIGYTLTHLQILAIRQFLKSVELDDLRSLLLDVTDNGICEQLLGVLEAEGVDGWLDLLQRYNYVNVGLDGLPQKGSQGISSYVILTKQPEYVEHVGRDPRLGSLTSYPAHIRAVEDLFIHGEYLLMVPIFLEGNVAACLWMNSNKPIPPDIRFSVISSIRKYEYRVSQAIAVQWKVLQEYGETIEREWARTLSHIAAHPLHRLERRLTHDVPEINFVREIIRTASRTKDAIRTERFCINQLIEQVATALLLSNHATLDISIDPTLTILSNRDFLAEVFRVVLENALRQVRDNPAGKIKVYVSKLEEGNACLIEVWDSGDLFPIKVLPDLFIRNVESAHPGGSGIGLHSAWLIMERLGGNISLGRDQKTIRIRIPL